jgi:stalled ribosome rescue protein Dom34
MFPLCGTVIEFNSITLTMTMNNQKQFGVWMDNHQAAVVGSDNTEGGTLIILAHVKGEINSPNSNEKNSNNNEKTIQAKFFKEIASHLTNATHIHVTGTGQVQEQFIHYLADTPQFKNSKTAESTSNKMSDEKLIEYITAKVDHSSNTKAST